MIPDTSSGGRGQPDKGWLEIGVLWLEAQGLIWPAIITLAAFALTAINAHLHNDAGSGFVLFLIICLVLWSGDTVASNFFGASSIALVVVIHIALFGINKLALVASFVLFMMAHRLISKTLLANTSIYLLLDSSTLYFFDIQQADLVINRLASWFFQSSAFMLLITVIPSLYSFVIMERWIQARSKSRFLKLYGTFYLLGTILIIAVPIALISESTIAVFAMAPAFVIYFYAILAGTDLVDQNQSHRKFWPAIIPMIIVTLEIIIITSIVGTATE